MNSQPATFQQALIDNIVCNTLDARRKPSYLQSGQTFHMPREQGPAMTATEVNLLQLEERVHDYYQHYIPTTFKSYFGDSMITSSRANTIFIDDPIAEHNQETPMATKQKVLKKDYNTVAVRFIYGHSLEKRYTYKVPKKAKLHLGQEIVVPSGTNGLKSVAVIVELHTTPQDTGPYDYKFVSGKVAPL